MCDVERGRRPPLTPERIQQLVSLWGEEDAKLLLQTAMLTRPVELPPSRSVAKVELALTLAHGWNDIPDTVVVEIMKQVVAAIGTTAEVLAEAKKGTAK